MSRRLLPYSVLVLTIVAAFFQMGCDITKLTANSTSRLFQRAAPGVEQHWDYELAGDAFPGNIMQQEGLLRVVPENEIIIGNAVRMYTAYAYGWVEDRVEQHRLNRELDEANNQLERARYMYLRARELAKHRMALSHEGFDEHYAAGLEDFEQWLQDEFTEPEDAQHVFWVGYTWGSYINASKDDMVAVADLPFAVALVRRSVELDESFFNYAGATFLAVVETVRPGGADLDAAQARWDHVLEVTERHNLLALVNMARTYAVARQDRELYISLLREVLEAGDVSPEHRLSNMIAKRRAARYLRMIDDRIPQTE